VLKYRGLPLPRARPKVTVGPQLWCGMIRKQRTYLQLIYITRYDAVQGPMIPSLCAKRATGGRIRKIVPCQVSQGRAQMKEVRPGLQVRGKVLGRKPCLASQTVGAPYGSKPAPTLSDSLGPHSCTLGSITSFCQLPNRAGPVHMKQVPHLRALIVHFNLCMATTRYICWEGISVRVRPWGRSERQSKAH
jgi:hypothetical protein